MTKKKTNSPIKIPSAKNEDQFATRKIVFLVRGELTSEIRSQGQKMESGFKAVDARFDGLEARFSGIDSRFKSMDSQFEELRGESFRMQVLFEEQNSNNRIVLEGLQALWQRQERIEKQLDLK